MKLAIALALLVGCREGNGVPLACRDYDTLAQKAVDCARLSKDEAAKVHEDMEKMRGPEAERTCRGMFNGLKASLEGCLGLDVFESP